MFVLFRIHYLHKARGKRGYLCHVHCSHFKFVGAAVLEVLHHGIEAGAAGAGGYRDGVHVELHGDDATLEAFAYLVGDVVEHAEL